MRYQIVGCPCPCGGFTLWDLTRSAAHPFYLELRPDGTGHAYREQRPRPCNVAYAVPLPVITSQITAALPVDAWTTEVFV